MNNFDGSSFTIGIYADKKDNTVTMSKIINALSTVDLHFANKIFTATTASEMPQLMNFDKPVEQVSHYIDESHKILYGLACWHPYFENVIVGLDQHANDNKGYVIRLSFDSDVLGIPVALRDEQDNDDALLFWSTATTIMTNLSVKLNACYAAMGEEIVFPTLKEIIGDHSSWENYKPTTWWFSEKLVSEHILPDEDPNPDTSPTQTPKEAGSVVVSYWDPLTANAPFYQAEMGMMLARLGERLKS